MGSGEEVVKNSGSRLGREGKRCVNKKEKKNKKKKALT